MDSSCSFYWEVLKRASVSSSFWHAERLSGFFTGLAAALVAYFGWKAPGGIEVVFSLIFLGVFGAVFIILFGYGLVTAPYKMWLEEKQRADAIAKLDQSSEGNESFPDMTIRKLFFHIDPDPTDNSGSSPKRWQRVGREILDTLSVGRLTAWGRELPEEHSIDEMVFKGTSPDKIDKSYWRKADWTYRFFDEQHQYVQHTYPPRGEGKPAYADVQFNRDQVLKIWLKDEMPRQRLRFGNISRVEEGQLVTFYIEIFNRHPTKQLTDVICRIERLTGSTGKARFERLTLRTENQTGDRPKGRFNLDQASNKLVAICSVLPVDLEDEIHILHAETGKKTLPSGSYRIVLSASAPEGGEPIETVAYLSTSPEPDLSFSRYES